MEPTPDENVPTSPSAPIPVLPLNYQSSNADILRPRRQRRTVPKPFGIGFFPTAMLLTVSWLFLNSWSPFVPHVALYLFGTVVAAGLTLLSNARWRLAGLGVLMAAGIWMLLLGTCYTMGGVRPMFL